MCWKSGEQLVLLVELGPHLYQVEGRDLTWTGTHKADDTCSAAPVKQTAGSSAAPFAD